MVPLEARAPNHQRSSPRASSSERTGSRKFNQPGLLHILQALISPFPAAAPAPPSQPGPRKPSPPSKPPPQPPPQPPQQPNNKTTAPPTSKPSAAAPGPSSTPSPPPTRRPRHPRSNPTSRASCACFRNCTRVGCAPRTFKSTLRRKGSRRGAGASLGIGCARRTTR